MNSEVFALNPRKDPISDAEDILWAHPESECTLSNDILFYIAGYIAISLSGSVKCECINQLIGEPGAGVDHRYTWDRTYSVLYDTKNRGELTKPTDALFRVVRHAIKVVMAKPDSKCHPNLRQLLLISYNWHALEQGNSSFYLQSNCEIKVGSMTHGHQLTRSVLSRFLISGSDHIQDNKPQKGPGWIGSTYSNIFYA